MQLQQTLWISRKRTLGFGFIALGVLGALTIVMLNILRAATHPDIGPAQKIAFVGCAAMALLGITLAVFGVDPDTVVADDTGKAVESPRGLLWVRRALLAVAAALMLFHLVVYVIYALSLAQFPFDYDQGEGFELNDTVLLSQGQSPYRNNEVYPFYASNYPPLYHVVLIPFVWLFGPQYWYGRLIGFAATLITAGAIAYAVYRQGRHRLIALLSGLAFLASNYIYHIGPLFRQHIFIASRAGAVAGGWLHQAARYCHGGSSVHLPVFECAPAGTGLGCDFWGSRRRIVPAAQHRHGRAVVVESDHRQRERIYPQPVPRAAQSICRLTRRAAVDCPAVRRLRTIL